MSHKDIDALRNMIGKMTPYIQQSNIDVARLKLEILSLKNHVHKLEEKVNSLENQRDGTVDDSTVDDNSSGIKPSQDVKTLDSNAALAELSKLTGMRNSARVPM